MNIKSYIDNPQFILNGVSMSILITATKSHLLAYLKHTEDFEKSINMLVSLTVKEILDHVKEQDMFAYTTCIFRFKQQGIDLETVC